MIGTAALPITARSDGQIGHAQAVTAANGMVVTQEARAANVGAEILQKGGNAVDAAVAVGFAMAVTYPRAGKVVLLPHLGSATLEGRVDMGEKVIVNIKTFMDGHRPPDRVLPSML